MQQAAKLQALLAQIRRDYCRDNATELARRIGKDASYVHRLFYPSDKKGAKGIGLEIMNACTEAFKLPPGFWDGAASNQGDTAMEPQVTYTIPAPTLDEWTVAAITIMKSLDTIQKAQMVAKMREYKQFLGHPATAKLYKWPANKGSRWKNKYQHPAQQQFDFVGQGESTEIRSLDGARAHESEHTGR